MSDTEVKDPVVLAVIESFKARSAAGIQKYKTTLAREDLSTLNWIQHTQEELMDAILYLERLKQDFNHTNLQIQTPSEQSSGKREADKEVEQQKAVEEAAWGC